METLLDCVILLLWRYSQNIYQCLNIKQKILKAIDLHTGSNKQKFNIARAKGNFMNFGCINFDGNILDCMILLLCFPDVLPKYIFESDLFLYTRKFFKQTFKIGF